jgi:uncharacterized protein YbjT (DUF2867 family)
MKIVVIGGTGGIGKKLVRRLRQLAVETIAASPSLGVDAVTGAGLTEALSGATVVVDVSNSPSLEGTAAMQFFDTAARNILAGSRIAGVQHYIVLSIVGVDRLLEQTYFQAKRRQEDLVRVSGLPFTVLRSTQFFEFISAVVQQGTEREISISPALTQPVAAEEVAETLAEVALGDPLNSTLELAGPERSTSIMSRLKSRRHMKTVVGSSRTFMRGISVPSFRSDPSYQRRMPEQARCGSTTGYATASRFLRPRRTLDRCGEALRQRRSLMSAMGRKRT